jgi:hypothetical protein
LAGQAEITKADIRARRAAGTAASAPSQSVRCAGLDEDLLDQLLDEEPDPNPPEASRQRLFDSSERNDVQSAMGTEHAA